MSNEYDLKKTDGNGTNKLAWAQPVINAWKTVLEITELEQTATSQGTLISGLRVDLTAQGTSISTLVTLTGNMVNQITALQEQDGVLGGCVTDVEEALIVVQGNLEQVETGLDSQAQVTDDLSASIIVQAGQLASLSGQVAGSNAGYDYRRALFSQLPATPNAAGKTELANVYGDTASLNGNYYRDPGNTTWLPSAGNQDSRIATLEMLVSTLTASLQGVLSFALDSGTTWRSVLAAGSGMDDGNANVYAGINLANELVAVPSAAMAEAAFAKVANATKAALGEKLSPQILNNSIEFTGGVKLLYLDVAGADGRPIQIDGEGHWRLVPGSEVEETSSLPLRTVINEVIGDFVVVLGYGQSNSIGADGLPIISTTQPYNNKSFTVGPRAGTLELGGMAALVETTNPRPDGDANGGETFCWGLTSRVCEKFSETLSLANHPYKFFASTAGRGGSKIVDVDHNSAWWPLLTAHMTAAKALINGTGASATCLAIIMDIGETDNSETFHTDRATFRTQFTAMCDAAIAATRTLFNQSFDPLIMVVTVSYNSVNRSGIPLAFWDLRDDPRFMLAMPDYWLQSPTGLHRTAAGHQLTGLVLGDAFHQYFNEHRLFKATQPYKMIWQAKSIRLYFKAPLLPIVIDDGIMVGLVDHGIKAVDATGTLTLVSFAVVAPDCLEIITNRDKSGQGTVTGGIAYSRSTPGFVNGCLGIRDSTAKVSQGQTLRNYSLAFEFID